jgi:hypothetical protein
MNSLGFVLMMQGLAPATAGTGVEGSVRAAEDV